MAKITYDDKVTLNEQPSIANVNKVTDDDMNEIKNVVNTNDDNVGTLSNLKTTTKTSTVGAINEMVDGEAFSTTEVKTNKKWVNGKPIYRKAFYVSSFPNATNSWISSGVSNLETVVELRGFASNGNEQVFLSSAYSTTVIDCLVYDYVFSGHNQSIRIHTLSNRSSYSGYVWIEYTKTTD